MNGVIHKIALKDGQEQSYAFITGEDNKQYFLHASNFQGDWHELSGLVSANTKVRVSFNPVDTPRGGRAENCVILGR